MSATVTQIQNDIGSIVAGQTTELANLGSIVADLGTLATDIGNMQSIIAQGGSVDLTPIQTALDAAVTTMGTVVANSTAALGQIGTLVAIAATP